MATTTTLSNAIIAPATTTSPAKPPVIVDQQLTNELQHTFDVLVDAATSASGPALAACFDGPTLFDNLREIGLLNEIAPKSRPAAGDAFVADAVALLAKSRFFPFSRLTVVQATPLPGADRVRVTTRAAMAGQNLKYVWWLKKSDARWRIYDFETPNAIHRWFVMAASNDAVKKQSSGKANAHWPQYVDQLTQMRDNVTRGIPDGVSRVNAQLIENKILFPAPLEGIRSLLAGKASSSPAGPSKPSAS